MSNSVSAECSIRKYHRRNATLNLELSLGIPGLVGDQVGSSSGFDAQTVQSFHQQNALALIDVDLLDDEVMISSPRTFAEARNNSRRPHTTNFIVDVDSVEQAPRFTNCYKRMRRSSNSRPVTIDQVFINLEAKSTSKKYRCAEQPKDVPLPPPPPEPIFSCPICMGELVEESSTKCGHIFCKKCIHHAISIKSICPTCRKKVNKKEVRRIYLPTTR